MFQSIQWSLKSKYTKLKFQLFEFICVKLSLGRVIIEEYQKYTNYMNH